MTFTRLAGLGAVAALASLVLVPGASALDDACNPGKAAADMSSEEALALYECIAADLDTGWQKGPKRWIPQDRMDSYRDWELASTFPAAPGMHGERFLLTRVNAVGFDAYTQYSETPDIPAGTLIAKESFHVNDAGKVSAGPLFFMEKVAEGTSPETMDWYYYAVAPNGTPMAVNVMTACNSCHVEGYGWQGGMGYPVEEARLTN